MFLPEKLPLWLSEVFATPARAQEKAEMAQGPIHILVVHDDSSDPLLVDGLLDEGPGREYRPCHVNSLEQAQEVLVNSSMDCILLDLQLSTRPSLESVSRLQGLVPDIPIVVLTGVDDLNRGVEAVQRGAQDCLLKGRIGQDDLVKAVEFGIERSRIREQLRQGSMTDELTGLKNRGGFDSLVEHAFNVASRKRQRLVLLYMDLDSMKSINDSLGHGEGDAALIDVAGLLNETYRDSDLVGRVGGDEFCVLLTGASDREAQRSVLRLEDAVGGHNRIAGRPYQLSLSIGMATFDPDAPCSVADLLNKADAAMYEAKRGGVDSAAAIAGARQLSDSF
jgi:two-component system, cell cycle response regulator